VARRYSNDYTQTLDDHGVLASIGTVGDAYDNASAESFVDSFKTELIRDRVWRTRSQLELTVVEYVAWFNNERIHTSLEGVPPAEFERNARGSGMRLLDESRKPIKRASAKPGRAHTDQNGQESK
jgi:transposase InsO family protein